MDGTNGRGYVEPPGGDKARRSLEAWLKSLYGMPPVLRDIPTGPTDSFSVRVGTPPYVPPATPPRLHLIVRDDCAIIVERILMLGEPAVEIDGRTLAVIQRECGDAIATALGYLTEPQQQAVLRAVL